MKTVIEKSENDFSHPQNKNNINVEFHTMFVATKCDRK